MDQLVGDNYLLLKKAKVSSAITSILGFLSVVSIILLYLALSDIADNETDLTLEWYIAGVCLFILSIFTASTFVTVRFLLKLIKQRI